MIAVELSQRELLAAWMFLTIGTNWGGGEDVILAQEEVWTACGLDDKAFTPMTNVDAAGNETPALMDLRRLSEARKPVALSENGASTLRQMLAARGQDRLVARGSAAAIARIKKAVEAYASAKAAAEAKAAAKAKAKTKARGEK